MSRVKNDSITIVVEIFKILFLKYRRYIVYIKKANSCARYLIPLKQS